MAASPAAGTGGSRREQILTVAAQLFAKHGFHGVSIADLGAAVGVSGPALYRHFPGKEALLAEMLVGISEHLLAGGQARACASDDPREVLAALVEFQADFALREPELIVVQDRDLANLPAEARRRVRRLQRTYVEIWVDTLQRVHPGLTAESARIAAHGAFGLLNSTPHIAPGPLGPGRSEGRPYAAAALLSRMALAALMDLPG
ncbi:SACE_7040 family transcriptional regulator [Pseudonocardia xinjiangensis]|uniref:SACE_7040 family transcriptional regulator n=1 Tax=Pseudonocardia xinjiangensis TaxID=75289 RepID=UPI003D948F2C